MNNEQNKSVSQTPIADSIREKGEQEAAQNKALEVPMPSGHTIHQLAKMARRIPRIISSFKHKLKKKNLTPNQTREYMHRLVQAEGMARMLQNELEIRKVTAPAKIIDPAVKRRTGLAHYRSAVGKYLAVIAATGQIQTPLNPLNIATA